MVAVAGGKAVVIAGGGGGGGGGGAAGSVDGCGACCFEADPDAVKTEERWVYVGQGGGNYSQVSNMEMVGAGRGEFEKQKTTTVGGYRLRACALGTGCILLILVILLPIGFANGWWSQYRDPIIDNPCDMTPMEAIGQVPLTVRNRCCAEGDDRFCMTPTPAPDKVVVHDKYYTQVKNLKVPHMVPVPIPPPPRKVITHHVTVHTHAFDCDGDASGDTSTWSSQKQRYCCYLRGITCHTKVIYKPHYHTITHTKTVTVPVKTPIPAPPAQVVNKVVNVPIHDPPQVIKVPVPGKPEYVPKYVHQKHYVPVPEPSPPQYHNIPVPVKVKDPGQVIKVPVPLPPQTIVKNKVIYKTRHVKVQHIYDCKAGFNNWNAGWSSAKKSWCCSHESRGCPGDHSGSLTKTYVTHVTEGRPHTVYHTHHYVTHHVSHEYVPTHVVHHWGGSGHFGGDSYGSGSGATTVVHHYHSGSGSSGSSHSWGGSSGSSFGASPSFRGSKSFSGSHSFSSHSYGSSGSFGGGSHSYGSSGSFGGSHSFKGGSFGGSHVFGASHGGSMSGSHSSSGHFSFSTSSSSGDHAKHN